MAHLSSAKRRSPENGRPAERTRRRCRRRRRRPAEYPRAGRRAGGRCHPRGSRGHPEDRATGTGRASRSRTGSPGRRGGGEDRVARGHGTRGEDRALAGRRLQEDVAAAAGAGRADRCRGVGEHRGRAEARLRARRSPAEQRGVGAWKMRA